MSALTDFAIEYSTLCLRETDKGHLIFLFESAAQQGSRLASELGADREVVELSIWLMDAQLGQAARDGRDHIEMAIEATREFLKKHDVASERQENILTSIKLHHGSDTWPSLEAEIVANADCYKFLLVGNLLQWINLMGSNFPGKYDSYLDFVEFKVEEKWGTVSLALVKEELEPHYKLIKEMIIKARN